MAQKGIREFDAKKLFYEYFFDEKRPKLILVNEKTDFAKLEKENPWLLEEKLVAKPDQLFGKRKKHNLVLLNKNFKEIKNWIKKLLGKRIVLGKVKGRLSHFLIEPFFPHKEEFYLAILAKREFDELIFSEKGGVDIEENIESLKKIQIPVGSQEKDIEKKLEKIFPRKGRESLKEFILKAFQFFKKFNFSYLEMNPFIFYKGNYLPLDMVVKIDDRSLLAKSEINLEFPPPFGFEFTEEEKFVEELDKHSSASLKFKILNPKGKIWLITAGAGASLILSDTVAQLGYGKELANYSEYSGNPNADEMYLFTKAILNSMLKNKAKNKILIIAGGIANFTDVKTTFLGIKKAIEEKILKLKKAKVKIFVRRGGPGYQEGLKMMKELGKKYNLEILAFGPELYLTDIIKIAIKKI